MNSLLCVFISQYNNKVDFIFMGEAQMGGGGGADSKLREGFQGSLVSPGAATEQMRQRIRPMRFSGITFFATKETRKAANHASL